MRTLLFALITILTTSAIAAPQDSDSLKVFVCGSSSPLADLKRARACIAVVTDKEFFLFDSGSGSGTRLSIGGLPMERLSGVVLTHFHSDHISDVYNINLTSWASGRKNQLTVYGPAGIGRVINGFNEAYALDRTYRVAHHGEELLNPADGVLQAAEIKEGVFHEQNGLRLTAVAVDHSPISPAFGYRVDYKGRSVVISGDTVVSPPLMKASRNVDLLLHDALSPAILDQAIKRAKDAGRPIRAKILSDVTNYHAHTLDIVRAADEAGVKQLAFYHLVPPPRDKRAEAVFMSGVPKDVILTQDLMWFELPVNSDELNVLYSE